MPETLVGAMADFEAAYDQVKDDPDLLAELALYRKDFIGGLIALQKANKLTEMASGETIWLKRERLGTHWITQDQQRCWSSIDGQAYREDPHYSRDRDWSAWSRHREHMCQTRIGLHCIHGSCGF